MSGKAKNKESTIIVPVRIDRKIFQDFSVFDTLVRQRRWQRPLVFALILLFFAVLCFAQVGKREGAILLGSVLTVVGLGLPAVYFGMFFYSVRQQAGRMGLSRMKDAYRVELGSDGVCMHPAGSQDKAEQAERHAWAEVFGAWRTDNAVYLYVGPARAFILPEDQIPGGADAAWKLLGTVLPAEKLHGGKKA